LFDLLMHRLWPIDAESLEEQGGAEAPIDGSPSKRERWATPVFEVGDQAVPRQKAPPHEGPSSYAREQQRLPDSHRRFSRNAVQASPPPEEARPRMNQSVVPGTPQTGYSSITKSSIVFNEAASGELGAVLERMRASIARRGLKGWTCLAERFESVDHRRNGGTMKSDFQRVHRGMGLGLSPKEQELVFKYFVGRRRDGSMDYRECLRALRGPLPERRAPLVRRLFEDMCQGGGAAPGQALKARFDARSTPMVLVGVKDAATEQQDFHEAVDHFSTGGFFEEQAFVDFFTLLSSVYKEEDEFKLMTTTVFGLHGAGIGGG